MKPKFNRMKFFKAKKTAAVFAAVIAFLLIGWLSGVFGRWESVYGTGESPEPKCKSAILMDVKTGVVLYEKDSKSTRTPASLTKIMSCILILEKLDLNAKVTVPKAAVGIQGNNMALKEGEILTVRQLVEAMMIHSANDASVALAITASGSQGAFVSEMNKRAMDIGATHTHFLNPNGFTESFNHRTTAEDMAIITREALKNEEFRRLVDMKKCIIPATNMSKERKYGTTNKLLTGKKTMVDVSGVKKPAYLKGAFGVKTGMMLSSGWCFIGAAKRGDTELLAVVLNTPSSKDRFGDAIMLIEYGFNNFRTKEVIKPEESCGRVKVKYGAKARVETVTAKAVYMTLPKDAADDSIEKKIILREDVKAPIQKGSKVGVVEIYEKGKKVNTVDVLISESAKRGGPWTAIYISDRTAYILGAVIFFIGLSVVVLRMSNKRRNRQRSKASKY